ncbi:MAG: hypothetical protein ABIJ42_11210 [Acidobacteriota bacterium]
MKKSISRREMIKTAGAAAAGAALWSCGRPEPERAELQFPVRAVTRGPKHHWFAYYDKLEFCPEDRYLLSMEVDFEHRSPHPEDIIKTGMVGLQDSDKWIELGESRSWGWQQGCMLQWLPGSADRVIWNDREEEGFVSRILNVQTREMQTLPAPVYSITPDGKTAVYPDFSRINDMRPGYGYAGFPDMNADQLAPSETGISRLDLERGKTDLIIPISEIAALPWKEDISANKHYFNHLLVNPDGTRFIFLHRWRTGAHQWKTRMLTANLDGTDIRVIDDCGVTSHFIWRDPVTILAWSHYPGYDGKLSSSGMNSGFCLFEDQPNGGNVQLAAGKEMAKDGHCTYIPGNRFILNDSYPDQDRISHVMLYDTEEKKVIPVADFLMPAEYQGEWRCDLHPRSSRNEKYVAVDAPYENSGRQILLIDISQALTG